MVGEVETQEFKNSAEFINWARRIVKGQYLAYHRVPVGKQIWTYGNGDVEQTEWGAKGGTMLSNLGYMLNINDGKLDGPRDVKLVSDIDACGGLVLTVDWG